MTDKESKKLHKRLNKRFVALSKKPEKPTKRAKTQVGECYGLRYGRNVAMYIALNKKVDEKNESQRTA